MSGTINIWAVFTAKSNAFWLRCRVYVYKNTIQLCNFGITQTDQPYLFQTSATVGVGDTIDFIVGPETGYENSVNEVTVNATITNSSVGTASGNVTVNATGHPGIAGAQVKSSDGRYLAVSDTAGAYSMTVPVGTVTLTGSATYFNPLTANNITITSGQNTTQNFDLTGGTLSGTITSNESGNPAILGAVVATDGDPGTSTTTAANGSYSLNVPTYTKFITVFAAGHDPQRMPISITAGGTQTSNFSMNLSRSSNQVTLPAPTAWGAPVSAPASPGDSFGVTFASPGALPDPNAPEIAGCNETAMPDESINLTGTQFTTRSGADAGTDTTVWVWAASGSGGYLKQAKIWKVTSSHLVATIPSDVAYGMYFVWVENSVGASAPVCINRATAQWIGPLGNTAQAGTTKRVFGRNLSYGHGTTTSYVYVQPAAGGTMTSCAVTKVEPYAVWFTVPAGLSNGNYKVYVHSGQGGQYGWSDPLDLVVQPDFARGAGTINLTPSGVDDTVAIQNAINTQNGLPNGGVVSLSAGTFIITGAVNILDKVELRGAGIASTTISIRLPAQISNVIGLSGNNVAMTNLTVNVAAGYAKSSSTEISSTSTAYSSAKLVNVGLTADTGMHSVYGFTPMSRTEISGCVFDVSTSAGGDGWIHDSTFHGAAYFDAQDESALSLGSRDVIENNQVLTQNWPNNGGNRNYIEFIPIDQLSHMVWAKRLSMVGGTNGYLAHNTTTNVAVQDNRGEMILFHGFGGRWFGNVLSSNVLTLTLRTDGLVDGQTVTIPNYGRQLTGGQEVPAWSQWNIDAVVITDGKGRGQMRQVVSQTLTTVTVDRPWNVQPDSTSKALITTEYSSNIIYQNTLNAFPVGYDVTKDGGTASCGIVIDGDGWANMVEGNISHRTQGARGMIANGGGPTYWNEMRGEQALDMSCNNWGDGLKTFWWDANPAYPVSMANAYRGCSMVSLDSPQTSGSNATGLGNIFENTSITSKVGYALNGTTGAEPTARMVSCSIETAP